MRIRKKPAFAGNMPEEKVLLMAKVSDALSHPARIRILKFIMAANKKLKPVCNKDVVQGFDYAQATISQHIQILSSAGLVQVKREDKFSYYYANIGMLRQYIDITKNFL